MDFENLTIEATPYERTVEILKDGFRERTDEEVAIMQSLSHDEFVRAFEEATHFKVNTTKNRTLQDVIGH